MIQHTNVRGANITAEQEAKLFARMRTAGEQEQHAYKSMLGADVAEAPIFSYVRHCYQLVWEGVELEAAITLCDAAWREYAAQNNAKVDAAPKIRRGPSAGHSSIHHRWTSPEKFQGTAIHIRQMVRIILGGVS